VINHLALAWRNLNRQRIFSIINVAGLSIGMTCALVVTIFVRYEFSFDQHHAKAKKIYKVVQDTNMGDQMLHWNTTAYPLAEALRHDFSQLKFVTQASGPTNRMFRIQDASGNISRFEEPLVLFVDPFYPKVFDFHWLQGDPSTALKEPNSCVLTETTARKYFPVETQSSSLLGKQIFLNNKDALTVTGLIEDAVPTTSLQYSMLIPYDFFRVNNPYSSLNWSGNYQGTTFIVMNDDSSPVEIEQSINTWKKKYLRPEDDARINYRLLPLTDSHTDEKYGYAPQSYTMPRQILYASVGVGAFMLLMACVNFVNLATAQAAGRAREVGIRKVMGSSRFGLIRQFLHENLLIIITSSLIALALTQTALSSINQMLSIINLKLHMDLLSVAIVMSIGTIVMIAASLYPAIALASYRPVEALKSKLSGKTGNLSLRRTLIVFQFSIVQIFVIGTMVVASQMYYLNNTDLGFRKDQPVVLANLNELDRADAFVAELLKNSAISEVCLSSSSPMSDYNHHYGTSFRLPGQREEDGKEAEEKGVDLNYLKFYDLQVVAGRNFSAVRENFDEFIVNEKLIDQLGIKPSDAIGRRLIINEGEATIVGVIKDFHNHGLQEELTPCVLLNSSRWLERTNIKIASKSNLPHTLTYIESTWKKIYPDGVFNSVFLDDVLARNYTLERLVFKGFIVLAILTIIIGCMGLYGLLSFITLRKTKEVGIRKTLGATATQIVSLFAREFVLLICVAFLLASPLAYFWLKHWLETFAYHIDMGSWMFISGAFMTLLIALLTISYQTLKAALENPVEALKSE
jgi:putative ABC transport system permease protein